MRGEILGEPAGRRSFVLRLQGRRPGKSLLLLAHEDVVPANAGDWQVPPFAGVIKDGYVWGRGAVDIKNLVAAHAVAVRRLAAAGAPFSGTVVYAATADEEEGTVGGARWLVEHRPDLMRCDYVLNEGGGSFIRQNGRKVYLLETGEKGVAQFRIVVRGEAGHASVPLRRGNAVLGAARVVEALAAHELPIVIDASSAELVELLVSDAGLRARLREPSTARAALAELAALDEGLADMIEPLYGFAFSPTIVRSNSAAVNVYPSQVEVSVDCRMLAGRGEDEVETEVKAALAGVDADWSMEWIGVTRGNFSSYPTPFSDAVRRVLRRHVPEAELAATHSVGFTDSNWFRAAYPGTVAYNFAPHLVEDYAHRDAALPQRGRAHPGPRSGLPGAVRGAGRARAAALSAGRRRAGPPDRSRDGKGDLREQLLRRDRTGVVQVDLARRAGRRLAVGPQPGLHGPIGVTESLVRTHVHHAGSLASGHLRELHAGGRVGCGAARRDRHAEDHGELADALLGIDHEGRARVGGPARLRLRHDRREGLAHGRRDGLEGDLLGDLQRELGRQLLHLDGVVHHSSSSAGRTGWRSTVLSRSGAVRLGSPR